MRFNRMPWTSPFDELRRQMDRLFEDYGSGSVRPPMTFRAAYPALNVWDAGDTLCVEAEIPGVGRENIEVYAVGNELTLKGRRTPLGGDNLTVHRQERAYGEFTRVVALPAEVNPDKVEAVLKDGVLHVRLPKAEQARPRKIALQTN